MLKNLGKLMQIIALLLLPAAMLMQITAGIRAEDSNFSVSAMLLMLLFGVALFGIGRVVEGYGGT
jgi:hypothetical protein